MGGLEAAIVKFSEVGDWNVALRMDAEYFQKSTRHYLKRIHAAPNDLLSKLVERVQHPVEVIREYQDEGLFTLMAKNIRSNRVELNEIRYMPSLLSKAVAPNKLKSGDVLMTRTGANFGMVAPWINNSIAYACADILILRQPSVPTGYLSSFLSGAVGKNLVLRGGYGGAQPHIAPSYLVDMPIPRFPSIERRIANLVDQSSASEALAHRKIAESQTILLKAIGLAKWCPPEPLTYTASSANAFASGRLDAQFFAPRIQQLLDHLFSAGTSVGTVATSRQQKFNAVRHGDFDYIEISNLDGTGATASSRVLADAAPSRATWFVRPDDILTSTVRPIRRLSAQVGPEQDGFVCSSGFVVLEPTDVQAELLLTYLRLPIICELMDLFASASMYPAISEADILALPFPAIDGESEKAVVDAVKEGRIARANAHVLLDSAKRAVEIAIEDTEETALAYLNLVEGA